MRIYNVRCLLLAASVFFGLLAISHIVEGRSNKNICAASILTAICIALFAGAMGWLGVVTQ